MNPAVVPTAEALARVRALAERILSAEEVRAALAVPIGKDEEEEARSLIRWFRRRYPTPGDRLAYVRRAYRRWRAARPTGQNDWSPRLAGGGGGGTQS